MQESFLNNNSNKGCIFAKQNCTLLVLCIVNKILNDSLLPLDFIPIVLQVVGFSADLISIKQYLGKEVKMKMIKAMSATLAMSAVLIGNSELII